MRVTMNRENKEEEKVEYGFPILMEADSTGLLVLFTSETEGVVIDGGSSMWSVGEYCDDWFPCYQKMQWKKFTGTITLEND